MNKLSDLDIDADAIDAVFETLESEGINVINATEDETAVLPADVDGHGYGFLRTRKASALTTPCACTSRKSARCRSLTAEEEIELAKQMEMGGEVRRRRKRRSQRRTCVWLSALQNAMSAAVCSFSI